MTSMDTLQNGKIFTTQPEAEASDDEKRRRRSAKFIGSSHFLRTATPAPGLRRNGTTLSSLADEIYKQNPELVVQLESISKGKPDVQSSRIRPTKTLSDHQAPDEDYDTDLEYDAEEICGPPYAREEKHDTSGSLHYIRKCGEIGVVPVQYFLRHYDQPDFVMRFHGLGTKGAQALSIPLEKNTKITKLNLEGNYMESDGVIALCSMLTENLYISELGLAENCLTEAGAAKLCELLETNNRITRLDLSGNSLSDTSAADISEMMQKNITLRHLNLAHNRFGDRSGIHFRNFLYNNDTLQELDLSWNLIRTQAALQIADGLKENVGLKIFSLRMNGFGLEGSKAMGHALLHNRTLQDLDLSANRVPLQAAIAMSKALSTGETLCALRIGSNPIGAAGALVILNSARSNEASVLSLIDLTDVFVNGDFLVVKTAFLKERPGLVIKHGSCEALHLKQNKKKLKRTDTLKDRLKRNPLTKMKDYMVKNGLRLIDFFKQFDRDQSLTLTREEFIKGVQQFKINLSESDVDRVIRMLDSNQSGDIDFAAIDKELMSGDKEYKFLKRALLKEIQLLEAEDRQQKADKKEISADDLEHQAMSVDDMSEAIEEIISSFL